jgi:hypothetical protein
VFQRPGTRKAHLSRATATTRLTFKEQRARCMGERTGPACRWAHCTGGQENIGRLSQIQRDISPCNCRPSIARGWIVTRPANPRRQDETEAPYLNVRGTGRPVSHADWRSIHAYTSRSFHRRCFPILYAGNPHSFHLSRTVRSGMARIAATSRDDRSRLEPPSVPFCGVLCCPPRGWLSPVAGTVRLSWPLGVAGCRVSASASATTVNAAIRADTREACTCTLHS